jgi:hypothetical protein
MPVQVPEVLAVRAPHQPKQAPTSQLQPQLAVAAAAAAAALVMAAAAPVQPVAQHPRQHSLDLDQEAVE